jgi:hypothetical protein
VLEAAQVPHLVERDLADLRTGQGPGLLQVDPHVARPGRVAEVAAHDLSRLRDQHRGDGDATGGQARVEDRRRADRSLHRRQLHRRPEPERRPEPVRRCRRVCRRVRDWRDCAHYQHCANCGGHRAQGVSKMHCIVLSAARLTRVESRGFANPPHDGVAFFGGPSPHRRSGARARSRISGIRRDLGER